MIVINRNSKMQDTSLSLYLSARVAANLINPSTLWRTSVAKMSIAPTKLAIFQVNGRKICRKQMRSRARRKGKVFALLVLFEDITKSIKILFPAIKLPKVK